MAAAHRTTQPVLKTIYRKLGGRRAFGVTIASDADLARAVGKRLPLKFLIYIKDMGFSDREIGQFIISARTRRHRESRKEPLTVDESDRLVRLARVQSLAEDVFGDPGKANRWLRQGLAIIDGKTPLEVAQTDVGARVVEQIIAKLDWGAAA
jgi:putative toxin-antitoxin system antitoxin component (TIGR02293 family)